MTPRIHRLREKSLNAKPAVSAERALLLTRFYKKHQGKRSMPELRAAAFFYLCEHKIIEIQPDELIVGERGPSAKVTPTFPELTCHTIEDLDLLHNRPKTPYQVPADVKVSYAEEIIPFWRGRSVRDQIFVELDEEWKSAYQAGIFTEFMEQRAPGHTVADGKIYRLGLLDFKQQIDEQLRRLDFYRDAAALDKRQQLRAMGIAADGVLRFAERHAKLALTLAQSETDPQRRQELAQIAQICRRVPARAPGTFWEALQMYWFCHLAVITELNGWDAFCPGHLDQHLAPFYQQGLADGSLTREKAKELLCCFFIKFNNHPAPPKVGVTAAESSTYTDFANINLAGQTRDGQDGTNEISYILLEVIDELHLLQPSQNIQLAQQTPEKFLLEACRVIRQGYGFPSVFNADLVVKELLTQGKSLEDAREGGNSGCVETGAFGKEAYILTGYINLPKLLELALNNGIDPQSGEQLGPKTGDPAQFTSYEQLFAAWQQQLEWAVNVKIRGNRIIERIYAQQMPAPFLSILIDDCIANGQDYNRGGARYNTAYIQGVGIGTLTDSLAAIKIQVFENKTVEMAELLEALQENFAQEELLRLKLRHQTPKWGNDDDRADEEMQRAFQVFFDAVDGKPTANGGTYHINMLPTTSHVYFGSVTGATPDGRKANTPLSEGISPVQGMDRNGPTAVLLSAAKMDQQKTGGTLLNMKFVPQVLAGEEGLSNMASLIRTYFDLGGHHLQFNVVTKEQLQQAQQNPEAHRNLIVRVAGYSDYFCDLSKALQDEIITRTEQGAVSSG